MKPDETELEARMARLRPLAGPVAFEAGFAGRVMGRLARQPSLADALQVVFLRLAPLAAAAILILGAVNLATTRSSGQPLVDRVLKLPAVSFAAAYALETDVTVNAGVRP
ncbi:MAG: hypothetical protein ABSG61_04210 [Gemmatimonadales bacterium]|jgi:hypothetical protein